MHGAFSFQVCFVDFQLELFAREVVELQPRSIQLLSPTELTQYYIQTWTLNYHDHGAMTLSPVVAKN